MCIMEEMKDTFKKIAENYKDVSTRFIIISMLAMTNNYVHSFLVEMICVLAFISNKIKSVYFIISSSKSLS